MELPKLQPLSFEEQTHWEFSNQLQSSPVSHNTSFSKKNILTFCTRCTHNPGSAFLQDTVFFYPRDNSLSHMFVWGINMHSNLTHTYTHRPATWLSNSNFLQVSPSLLNQKWNLQDFCRTAKSYFVCKHTLSYLQHISSSRQSRRFVLITIWKRIATLFDWQQN